MLYINAVQFAITYFKRVNFLWKSKLFQFSLGNENLLQFSLQNEINSVDFR